MILNTYFRYVTLKFGSLFYEENYLEFMSSVKIIQTIITQKIFRINAGAFFPCNWRISIHHAQNVIFYPSDILNFHRQGNHFCAKSKIYIGKGTVIGPYSSVVTAKSLNHEDNYEIHIGKNCQICIHAIILPGVFLGNNTIVGAGSVVTSSFKEGNCTVAGNPARLIKINEEKT
jgi:acetyltransferase-like isoleucine patch superfamily enzyme